MALTEGAPPGEPRSVGGCPSIDGIGGAPQDGMLVQPREPCRAGGGPEAHQDGLGPAPGLPSIARRPGSLPALLGHEAERLAGTRGLERDETKPMAPIQKAEEIGACRAEGTIPVEEQGDGLGPLARQIRSPHAPFPDLRRLAPETTQGRPGGSPLRCERCARACTAPGAPRPQER